MATTQVAFHLRTREIPPRACRRTRGAHESEVIDLGAWRLPTRSGASRCECDLTAGGDADDPMSSASAAALRPCVREHSLSAGSLAGWHVWETSESAPMSARTVGART